MKVALAIAAAIIFVVHGLVVYQQFQNEYDTHQTAYFTQARGLAKTPAERAAVENRSPRIEQIIVANFGEKRVDRCTSCHIASDDPRFATYAQPLKTHPYSEALGDRKKNGVWERRHKFADFGCTVCHDGQGRGLKTHYGHGEDHYWPDPMLGFVTQVGWRKDYEPKLKGKEYLQANCAQCHTEGSFASTPLVAEGRRLFFSSNCYGCHRIEGLSDGTMGPDLTESGKKFKVDYLWESIADPRANLATSVMPQFQLTEAQTRALVVFLKSRKGRNFAETGLSQFRARLVSGTDLVQATVKPVVIQASTALQQGQKLIADRACTACHKLGDKDGGIAPDLSFAGALKDEQWLFDHFQNPRSRVPDSIMPAFRFSDEEFRAMSAYLASLKTGPQFVNGEQTYLALCARCHGDKGDGHGKIAIYLDPYPRDLTKAGFMTTKSYQRLAHSIEYGVPGTSMPAWGRILNAGQIDSVLSYVFATFTKQRANELKTRNVPEANPVAMSAESVARGEAMFARRCGGCHGRKGDGKGPNSLDILPRPRNLRNAAFVQATSDKRLFDAILYGVQGTAMPPWIDYGLTANDVGDLVNFIRSMNVSKAKGNIDARAD